VSAVRLPGVAWLLAGTLFNGRALAQRDPIFDGVWEGTIKVVASYGDRHAPEWLQYGATRRLRIVLDGEAVSLTVGNRGLTAKDTLIIDKLNAAAIVHEQVLNDHEMFHEIYLLQISLTKTETDAMLAYVWEVSNYTNLPAAADGSKVAWAGVGELRRIRKSRRLRRGQGSEDPRG
jgi:hypothetical protein